ncbi:MAG: hypothetical protein CVU06_00665 [Bacteroidetes bacterium HGW-Bacteroidetes-22]|nr:MAG: hypothetical protein CVU06_00665 [Bacteroidetes bacterium HGW-Bacteroidetes-22]
MRSLYKPFTLLIAIIVSSGLEAGNPEMNFGKVSKEELNMTIYTADSSANAVILYDFGSSEFRYDVNGDNGWQLIFNRKVRIKVFSKEGTSAGDFHFTLYHDGTALKEKLEDLEGITFNLENGKIVKTNFERENLLEKEEDRYHTGYSFAMPNVRAGSVIDVSYRIKSDFLINLQPWVFQYKIPVQWSEYNVSIPEYFIYKHTLSGYNPLAVNEVTDGRNSIVFTNKIRSVGQVTQTNFERETFHYIEKRFRLAMKEVPAFREEDYLTTARNYTSIYSFELASTKTQDNIYKDYTTTWEKINDILLSHEDFGKVISSHGYMKEALREAIAGLSTDQEKVQAVYELIKKRIRWDGHNALLANDLKKAWNESRGNAADINLSMVSALRMTGLQAHPVALSTRSNGFLNLAHPTISDFNYVIACVVTNTDTILLDATELSAPAGLLPVRCINGRGRLILDEDGGWVALKPCLNSKQAASYTLLIADDGTIEGSANQTFEGYNALDIRKELTGLGNIDVYFETREKNIAGLKYISHTIEKFDTLTLPLKIKSVFTLSDAIDLNSGLVIINPFLFEATSTNPFKLRERVYPVEFSNPFNETLMINWTVPNGFTVDHLPKPAVVVLPEKGGRFTYNILQNGNTITVISLINLNQTVFLPQEYDNIKAFFNQIITKQAESIILKRI